MAKKTRKTAATTTTTETEALPAPTTPGPVVTPPEAPTVQKPEVKASRASEKGSNVKASKSTIEKPTKMVWTVADEMKAANPNVTRKEIVDECIRRGVAYYTARTQYQRWSKSKSPGAGR